MLNNVSENVTSTTQDYLPSEYNGVTLVWETSDSNLYTIDNGKGYTNKLYQTHNNQMATITLTATYNGETKVYSKDVRIEPVKFEEMVNPRAAYFATSAAYHYQTNNTRYQTDNTLFSEKFRSSMDMVYYAFAVCQTDGTLTINTTYLEDVLSLKNDGIRVLLVIDGATSASLKAMVQLCNDDTTRATFVKNIMELVKMYNFDGVDVDWEFPGTSGLDGFTTEIDQINLNKLLRDLRTSLDASQDANGSPYILSVAIPATSWGSVRYNYTGENDGDDTLGGIDTYCDYVNMMSYDLNKTNYTTHIAAHYSSTISNDYKFGTVYGTTRFTSLGLTKSKIILGVASYGKVYSITDEIDTSVTYPGLNLSASLTRLTNIGSSFASGTIYYTGVKELIDSGNYQIYTELNNGNIVGSYLLNVTDKIFVTYDSVESVIAKCNYANDNGMGVMIWAYGEDATDELVHAMCEN